MARDNIACGTCDGTDFFLQDGVYICSRCQTQSQEHGLETVVDQETPGQYHSQSMSIVTPTASGKKRKRRKTYKISFRTIDAYTFIIKGWREEIIALGASPQVNEMVEQLWCQYLRNSSLGFLCDGKIAKTKTHRDFQVDLFGRKKILNVKKIKAHEKRRRGKGRGESATTPIDDLDPDDTSHAGRMKQRKRRSKFFKSVSSDLSISMDSLNSSVGSLDSFTESSDTEAAASRENKAEEDIMTEEKQMQILAKALGNKKNLGEKSLCNWKVFNLFSLAVILSEHNSITIPEIRYWADTDVLSYMSAVQNLPTAMKLQGREKGRFRPKSLFCLVTNGQEDTAMLRKGIAEVGSLLQLGSYKTNAASAIQTALERYVDEFCLPKELTREILRAVRNTSLLTLDHDFSKDTLFPCVATRAVALILFALKYLFCLDDTTEKFLSSSARKRNADVGKEAFFVVEDWMEALRTRIRFAVQEHPVFNRMFGCMFTGISLSDWGQQLQAKEEEDYYKKCKMTNVAERGPTIQDRSVFKSLARLIVNAPPDVTEVDESAFRESRTPLKSFTEWMSNRKPDRISKNEEKMFERLQNLSNSKITIPNLHSAQAEDAPLSKRSIFSSYLHQHNNASDNSIFCHPNSVTFGPKEDEAEECMAYNILPRYWLLKSSNNFRISTDSSCLKTFTEDNGFVQENEQLLISALPQNFWFLLQYFALQLRTPILLLYKELNIIEMHLIKRHKTYFGNIVHTEVNSLLSTNEAALKAFELN